MANAKAKSDLIPVEDYFEGEKVSQVRHEFVNGMVYAMAGGTIWHDAITLNIGTFLNLAVAPPCRVFNGNVQLGTRNEAGEWYHYPDVFVACGDFDGTARRVDDARVVFEVLSKSTQRSDRYEKFERCKTLSNVQEYVLVEQSSKRLEVYRRRSGWKQEFLHPDDPLVLESIKQTLTFEQIYRRVTIEAEPED